MTFVIGAIILDVVALCISAVCLNIFGKYADSDDTVEELFGADEE